MTASQRRTTLLVIVLAVLIVAAILLALGLSGCSGPPVVRPVGIGGEGEVYAVFAVGDEEHPTYVRVRVVAGAEYAAAAGLMGYGEGCVAINDLEVACFPFADECDRDPNTGFCKVDDDQPPPEEEIEP